MELRVLRYFLTVAQEKNITKAAEILHLTQPTLSRQMRALEEELGTVLFERERYQTVLTQDGICFRQRAQEIIDLVNRTEKEFMTEKSRVEGCISIGCGESTAMWFFADLLKGFSAEYPGVRYEMYSGYGDDICDKIDQGLLDLCALTEPFDKTKYEAFRIPIKERWGILMRGDDPLARKDSVTIEELRPLPLIVPKRNMLRQEIASWFDEFSQYHVFAVYNLLLSVILLVENGMGYAVCLEGQERFEMALVCGLFLSAQPG